MKLNVKGLVFVGFAAAVFASAAQADSDKIVTSKTYVDNKITQTLTTSTTTAPSENAVKEALALKYDASNPNNYITSAGVPVKGIKAYGAESEIQPDANGIVTLPQAAAVNNGTLSIQVGSNPAQTFTANTADNTTVTLGAAAGKGVATTVTANGTDLPTAGAVDTAINDAITTASGDYATAAQGALADTAVQSVVAGDSGVGTIKVDGTTVTAYGLGTAAGANTTTDTTLAASGETGKLPTAATVKSYVDSAITTASGDYATAAQGALADSAVQSVVAGDSGVGTIKVDGTTVTVYGLGTAAGAAVSTNGVADSETGLVSGDQVHDYVSTLNNGLNLPANGTGTAACSATKPCALVWTGTGQPTWEQIEQ